MMNREQKLILQQIDRKIKPFSALADLPVQDNGWINSIRKALNMSLRQLGKKLKVSPQAIRDMEQNEKRGTISLKTIKQVANAMELKVVYCLIPTDGSLEKLVEKKALEIARQIVNRTSQSMKLEDQENDKGRIKESIEEKKNELMDEIPKFLWD